MRLIFSIPLLLLLAGCADLGYYWHSARGHLALMSQRIDIDELLQDDTLAAPLRERLLLVQEIRRFSISSLGLPDNGSYGSYVALERPYVLQNLFAAPEFSTRLHQWCYPVIGCASYRGYYDEERLRDYVETLKARGLEVYVGGVSAYSSLGWFDDPVLSSFIDWPDYRLAGLLFHELTHQQLYIDDDTTFNESLASAVQQAGTELWLESRGRADEIEGFNRWLEYRDETLGLIDSTRERLSALYASDLSDDDKRARKQAEFETARAQHEIIAARHGITGGYGSWFAGELNNAKIGSVSAYNALLPAFVNMLEAQRKNFAAFYAYAERVGKLEPAARKRCLQAWQQRQSAALATDCPALD